MKKRVVFNIIIFVIVLYSWLRMVFGRSNLEFMARGLSSLKYFTILSNLLEAFACLIWIYNRNEKIKYVAAVSVTLTMMVTLLFLGPLFGYGIMFAGVNFWLHLFIPMVCLLEVLLWNDEKYTKKDNLIACLPLIIYGLFYLANNLINGKGTWPHTNDWYGFLMWGYPVGIVIFIVLILFVYFIGYLIRKIKSIR